MPQGNQWATTARSAALPQWSAALRAIREARGISQAGWAARLARSRNTVQRWETGRAVPDREAEQAIVEYCRAQALFDLPLGGRKLTAEGLQQLLAAARLGNPTLPPEEQPPDAQPPRSNLTFAPSSLVAREGDVEAIAGLLESGERLISLSGPGGVGKTRLALAVAQAVEESYPDGVWLVDLAPATPPMVVDAVAAAVGVREKSTRSPATSLVDALRQRRLLLVLDNCEHLLEACADLAELLLRHCPRVALLCTSREPLRVAGERVYPVATLPVPPDLTVLAPDPDGTVDAGEPDLAAALRYGAVQLFVERARAVAPGFALTVATVEAVAQICRRLDGLPLALELAAVRADTLSAAEIAVALDERFALLTDGPRTASPRHRTLRAAIDASAALLSEAEAGLFSTLAVFAGSFSLDAIAAVAGPTGSDDGAGERSTAGPSLEIVAALVRKSLLVREEADGRSRFRLLESLREYARDRLVATGDGEAAGERHRNWYLALAERLEQATWGGPEQAAAIRSLEAEHDNLRGALAWSLARGHASRALRLAGALGRFWEIRGHLSEGRHWLGEALAQGDGAPAVVRGKALNAAGRLAMTQRDLTKAEAWLGEALEIFRSLDIPIGIATVLMATGTTALWAGDLDTATRYHEEALQGYRALGHELGVAANLLNLGVDTYRLGDAARSATHVNEALAVFLRFGDQRGASMAHANLAALAVADGDLQAARTHLEEAVALARSIGDQPCIARWLQDLGGLAEARRDGAAAAAFYRECLPLLHELGDAQAEDACREALARLTSGDAPKQARNRRRDPKTAGMRVPIGPPARGRYMLLTA
jgi:non-specific serine/threonine protein kinase